MQTITKALIVITLFFSFAGMAKADAAPPTKQTTFYFQKDGQPLTQSVKFTIKCYGIGAMEGDNKLLKISETSKTCQSYGCKFDTSNVFEVYKQNIEYCNLEGEVNGEKFTVNNFLGDNLSGLSCDSADFTILTGGKYYKRTPKYEDCLKDVYREYYPQGNGEVKGYYLCDEYTTDEYLTPTTIPEPNGSWCGYGYTRKNNICYRIANEFFACTAEEQRKEEICNQYLEDVTSKLAKNENGYPFEEICEAKINVPVSISNTNNQQTPNVEPTPPIEQPQSKSIFIRIIDFFRCSFLKLFGKSC